MVAAGLIVAFAVPPISAERRLDIRKLEEGYVHSLELLAKGQREEALDALIQAETKALGESPSMSRIDRVWRHKLAVVRRALELTSHDVLVPVIVLHHDAYDRYRDAGKPIYARHARDMASDLAAYKVQSSGEDRDRQFAGWILASFGASILELRTASTSAGLLRDALDVSPNNPAALLGLSWAHEIHGEYEDAIELLDTLLRSEPEQHHAMLRKAVCNRRLGNLNEARRGFQTILKGATERWIRSLAYQELARTLVEEENPAGALKVASEGLEEFPGEQELVLLIATLAERTGDRGRSRVVVREIEPVAAGTESPRYLYDKRPDLNIDEARATLHRMQEDRLDLLATGLRWWGTEGSEAKSASAEGGR